MAEITGEIENIDKLFSEININGETHQSENYVEKETPVYQPAPEPVEEEPQLPPSEPVFVEREIEDISSLFSEINVNDTPHEQENYVEQHLPVYQPAPEPQEEEPFNPPPSVIGQDVTGIDLNSILHPIKDDNIGQQIETLNQAMQAIQQRMTELNALIPSQASASNKLADKAFVNSSVQTATANFRGNWNDFSSVPTDVSLYPVDYAGSKTPTVNDYLVVQDASDYTEDTLEGTWRFKYSGTWSVEGKNGWRPEYQVNETPLTQAQLEALNSGATASKIGEIDNKNGKLTVTPNTATLHDQNTFCLMDTNRTNPSIVYTNSMLNLWDYIKPKTDDRYKNRVPFWTVNFNSAIGSTTTLETLLNYLVDHCGTFGYVATGFAWAQDCRVQLNGTSNYFNTGGSCQIFWYGSHIQASSWNSIKATIFTGVNSNGTIAQGSVISVQYCYNGGSSLVASTKIL